MDEWSYGPHEMTVFLSNLEANKRILSRAHSFDMTRTPHSMAIEFYTGIKSTETKVPRLGLLS